MNVTESASGEKRRPFSISLASTKASIPCFRFKVSAFKPAAGGAPRALETWDVKLGTEGLETGCSDHHARSSSVKACSGPSFSGSARAVLAPWATHCSSVAISLSLSLDLPFGISPAFTSSMRWLFAASPGTIAGPLSPPFCRNRASRTSRPPFISPSSP